MIAQKTKEVLQKITDEINSEHGFMKKFSELTVVRVAFLLRFFSKNGMSFSKIRFISASF